MVDILCADESRFDAVVNFEERDFFVEKVLNGLVIGLYEFGGSVATKAAGLITKLNAFERFVSWDCKGPGFVEIKVGEVGFGAVGIVKSVVNWDAHVGFGGSENCVAVLELNKAVDFAFSVDAHFDLVVGDSE